MATVAHHCTFVLLLYLQVCYGQQGVTNNQNFGINPVGLQQQNSQWISNDINQIPNAGSNSNLVQQPNKQKKKSSKQVNSNSSPNVQSQTVSTPQNGFQITKIGFTPVSPGTTNPFTSIAQSQNGIVRPAVPASQRQNVPNCNAPLTQTPNGPLSTSTLAELLALKGHPSLLSLLNQQNNDQFLQNQQMATPNTFSAPNQLSDLQKQYLVRQLQAKQQSSGQNQNGMSIMQNQLMMANIDNQGFGIRSSQVQPVVAPLGNQPPYVTVQAPLTSYLPSPQETVDEEPSIMSLILSELDSQFSMNSVYPQLKKGSKPNLKTLLPLIINLIKERNSCSCPNCGCPSNTCQNNECPNTNNFMLEPMAQIFGGYSNQKKYGAGSDNISKVKKKEESYKDNKKEKKSKKEVIADSEESSEENVSDYTDSEEA